MVFDCGCEVRSDGSFGQRCAQHGYQDELQALLTAREREIAEMKARIENAYGALGDHPDSTYDLADRIAAIRDEGRAHFHTVTRLGEQLAAMTRERDAAVERTEHWKANHDEQVAKKHRVSEMLGDALRRVGELEGAIEPLVAACERDFTEVGITDHEPDDESVMAGVDLSSASEITFGMIRRARALLPVPAAGPGRIGGQGEG